MIGLETIPYLKELPEFLSRYGEVRFELVRESERLNEYKDMDFRIIVGKNVIGKYSISHHYGEYHSGGENRVEIRLDGPYPYIGCTLTLPDYNGGAPISLDGVYKNGSFRRLDAWWEREGIPRRDSPIL